MSIRIVFAGSCQVAGLRAAAQAMLPDAEIEAIHVGVTMTADHAAAAVEGADAVITNIRDQAPEGAVIGPEALAKRGGQALFLPTFVFRGFHPDLTYMLAGGSALAGPVGDYHSILTAAAFALDLPEDHAERLFNAHLFALLGYFDYAAERAATTATFGRYGYAIAEGFTSWEASGDAFMHTGNHPAEPVLTWLARAALTRLGIVADAAILPHGLPDTLASSVTAPVFPPIARRQKIAGTSTYRLAASPERTEADRCVTLGDHIRRSYALYRATGATVTDTPAIAAAAGVLRAALDAARSPAGPRNARSVSPGRRASRRLRDDLRL